jgi:hypothetical protein
MASLSTLSSVLTRGPDFAFYSGWCRVKREGVKAEKGFRSKRHDERATTVADQNEAVGPDEVINRSVQSDKYNFRETHSKSLRLGLGSERRWRGWRIIQRALTTDGLLVRF